MQGGAASVRRRAPDPGGRTSDGATTAGRRLIGVVDVAVELGEDLRVASSDPALHAGVEALIAASRLLRLADAPPGPPVRAMSEVRLDEYAVNRAADRYADHADHAADRVAAPAAERPVLNPPESPVRSSAESSARSSAESSGRNSAGPEARGRGSEHLNPGPRPTSGDHSSGDHSPDRSSSDRSRRTAALHRALESIRAASLAIRFALVVEGDRVRLERAYGKERR